MQDGFIIIEGKDYDKIIQEAAERLNVSKDGLDVEVLENRKTIFGSHYKLKIGIADKVIEEHGNTIDELENVKMNIDNVESYESTDKIENTKRIDLTFKPDGVYLLMSGNVTAEEVSAIINVKRIEKADIDLIRKSIEQSNFNIELKIAEPQDERLIDSSCTIKITKDAMQAFLFVTRPFGGNDISRQNIINLLTEKKVTFGIKNEVIDDIVNNKIYNKDILIAEGIEPINGTNAVIEYKFETSNSKKINISDDGKVDYHELSIIQNVAKGQLLAQLIPNTSGTAGENVLGIEISAKDGKKLTLPKGKNVEVGEDGLTLIAAIDGQVNLINGKINVSPVYEVKSDVDNSVGNIRFVGKVIVRGNVLTGFLIEAEDDVEVYGVVEGAKIVSKANIILHRGIQGMNKGELYCEGDLIAKFIENSKAEAKGNVVSDAIMHSDIICGKKLEVKGKKGLLVGGVIRVSEEVKAKVIGSPMSTITDIEVGTNPDVRKKYDGIKEETKNITSNLEKTSQAVDLLTKLSRTSELPADKKLLLSKSIQLKLQLSQKLEQMKHEVKELETYMEEITNGKIKASDIIYPGTRITIGSSKMYVKDTMKYSTFFRSHAEIRVEPYED